MKWTRLQIINILLALRIAHLIQGIIEQQAVNVGKSVTKKTPF